MKSVNFNDYFEVFYSVAQERGMNKSEFMKACGLPKQRFTDLSSGSLNFTGRYFNMCLGGLRLKVSDIEKRAAKKLTEEQRKKLKLIGWSDKHEDLIEYLADHPNVVKELQKRITVAK